MEAIVYIYQMTKLMKTLELHYLVFLFLKE